jgi:hypothetical protein
MKILIGCEESQAVCIEFRKLGFEAYSCDLKPCSGGKPEWHLQMDVFEAIKLIKPTLAVFHPTCTYLTVTANRWLKDQPKRESGRLVGEERRIAQREAIEFFKNLWYADIEHIAIENPIGVMSRELKKADQIIHPSYFGDATTKATCLWLKNLPKLKWTKKDNLFEQATYVEPEIYTSKTGKKYPKWSMIDACKIKDLDLRSEFRSKTFPGIAKAMAVQWGEFLKEKYTK